MPVCKKCFKVFKTITPSHVRVKHGYDSLEAYTKDTVDIEIPAEMQKEDDILREELRKKRSEKMLKRNPNYDPNITSEEDETIDSIDEKSTLAGALQAGFKRTRRQ